MNEETKEVLRGHVEECLRHLGESLVKKIPKGSKGADLAKKPMADFCKVSTSTIHRWFNSRDSLPKGEQFIGLVCYLDMVGYKVIELERLTRVRRNFAELIGFGLLSGEEASKLLGYAKSSTLYQILRGRENASGDMDQKMYEIWKERKDELKQKKEQSRDLYSLDVGSKVQLESGVEKKPASASRHSASIKIMDGLTTILDEELAQKLSAKDLEIFQNSADTLIGLSTRLSSLISMLVMSDQRKGDSDGK